MNFSGTLPKIWIPIICTKSLIECPKISDHICSAHMDSLPTASCSSASIDYVIFYFSLICIFLDKFTNIGFRLSSHIKKKINIWNGKSEQRKNESSGNYYDNEDISWQKALNNIFDYST
ncbi:hypothetical protein POVCU2_0063050 [Plasmodium ovale curtisi]|uniref:PIR Superfamily Protein n=1 Tax=Plasmodium ovale curtisi TaxID=864141 RepID=A0A1A8XBZ4_PLAOA|nr:hypothetical protein POVCU2_0063050 [Plasmodium ovale curtisi]SBT02727.1 hypothetical protein POVCU1_080100 [Plasmodium ovale curtisi]